MEEENKSNSQPETEPENPEAQEVKVEENENEIETETQTPQKTQAEPAKMETQATPEEELLLPRDTLLSAGIHIGTRMKTRDMEPFIYRVRPDGLFVLDVKKTDDRIRVAGKFLARYEPSKVTVAATRLYAHEPVKKFCQLTGSMPTSWKVHPWYAEQSVISTSRRSRNHSRFRPKGGRASRQRSLSSRHPNRSTLQH